MEIDVRRVAKLAMLEIPEDEVEKYEKELSRIVEMTEHLPEVENVKTLIDTDNMMELREDVVEPSYPREAMLKNVPQAIAGCIVVPKTVE